MSKDRKKLVHIHSSVYDKQPKSDALEYGELAVNYSDNMSFISTKKSNGSVVRFSDDDTLVDWIERKTVFPYKGEVEQTNLINNESKINFTFNQQVAKNTPHHDDAPNGFSVDMSGYAMINGNPTFNNLTVTNGAEIKGENIVISGTTSTIYRTPSEVKANTVDTALNEVLDRSKVTTVDDEENRLLNFFQDGKKIASITLGKLSPINAGEGEKSAVLVGDSQYAKGDYSFAEGQNTIAKNRSEHAMGEYNDSHKASNEFGNEGNTLFSIGNGTSESTRKNAFEVMQNGDIYIYVNGERVCLNDILTALVDQTY